MLLVCRVDLHQRGGGKQRALRGSRQRRGRELPGATGKKEKSKAVVEKARPKFALIPGLLSCPCSPDKVAPTQGPWALGSGLWGKGNEGCLLPFPSWFL